MRQAAGSSWGSGAGVPSLLLTPDVRPRRPWRAFALLGVGLAALGGLGALMMSRNDLERLILSKPQVALRILEITGRRLRDWAEANDRAGRPDGAVPPGGPA